MIDVYLPENLRFLRERVADLKQKDLAKKLGLGASTYGNYETGHSEPSFKTLKIIADFWSIEVDDLLYSNLEHNDNPPKASNASRAPIHDVTSFNLIEMQGEMRLMHNRLESIEIALLRLVNHIEGKGHLGVVGGDKDNTAPSDAGPSPLIPSRQGRNK